MQKTILLLVLTVWPLMAQAQPVTQQNARQALLEMLFGKAGSFEKHLPKATLDALRKANPGGTNFFDQFAMVASMAKASGADLQTFEAGSTLLTYKDAKTQNQFEVDVENDDLRGDEDEILLSFHGTKEGQPLGSPLMPTLSLLMKQETGLWKLNTISVTLRVPLADPNFLKTMVASMQQRAGNTATGLGTLVAPGAGTSTGPRPNEASAISSLRTILTAEVTYASLYPSRGYTCSLSELDGFGSDSPNEHQAMLIESGLASGKKAGYIFTVSGCAVSPSSRFQVVATPAAPGSGARSFCGDQSGLIRYSVQGDASTCLSNGKPLQ